VFQASSHGRAHAGHGRLAGEGVHAPIGAAPKQWDAAILEQETHLQFLFFEKSESPQNN
jgi:hypothetical protein